MRAISAFGSHLAMYTCPTDVDITNPNQQIQPALNETPAHSNEEESADATPRIWWSSDFVEEHGQKTFLEVVARIKNECTKEDEETS